MTRAPGVDEDASDPAKPRQRSPRGSPWPRRESVERRRRHRRSAPIRSPRSTAACCASPAISATSPSRSSAPAKAEPSLFHTAVAVIDQRSRRDAGQHVDRTEVRFRDSTPPRSNSYRAARAARSTAPAASRPKGSESRCSSGSSSHDPTALIGLPLIFVARDAQGSWAPIRSLPMASSWLRARSARLASSSGNGALDAETARRCRASRTTANAHAGTSAASRRSSSYALNSSSP